MWGPGRLQHVGRQKRSAVGSILICHVIRLPTTFFKRSTVYHSTHFRCFFDFFDFWGTAASAGGSPLRFFSGLSSFPSPFFLSAAVPFFSFLSFFPSASSFLSFFSYFFAFLTTAIFTPFPNFKYNRAMPRFTPGLHLNCAGSAAP